MHRARDGAVWAGTLSGGVSRLKDGVFTHLRHGQRAGVEYRRVDPRERRRHDVVRDAERHQRVSRGGWRRYATRRPAVERRQRAASRTPPATSGSARPAGSRSSAPARCRRRPTLPPVLRAIDPRPGRGPQRLAVDQHRGSRPAGESRRRSRTALLGDADVREYGVADGLLALEGVKRHRSVVADSRGRIWFAMIRGLSMADPARSDGRAVPALTQVEESRRTARRSTCGSRPHPVRPAAHHPRRMPA